MQQDLEAQCEKGYKQYYCYWARGVEAPVLRSTLSRWNRANRAEAEVQNSRFELMSLSVMKTNTPLLDGAVYQPSES